jgi:uncharacterized HAD superfamily protein
MKEVIGLDFDGVIGDIEYALQVGLMQMCGRTFPRGTINAYGLQDDLQLTNKEVDCLIDQYINSREITMQTPLLPGAREFILELLEHQPLLVITARKNLALVKQLLNKYFCLLHDEDLKIEFARSGTKGRLMREMGITVFVDDYWKNLIDAAEWGVRPVLVDQTWNRKPLPGHKRLAELTWRIKNLNELKPLLNGKPND